MQRTIRACAPPRHRPARCRGELRTSRAALLLLLVGGEPLVGATPRQGAYVDPNHYTGPHSFAGTRYLIDHAPHHSYIIAGSDDGAAAQATFRQPHGLSVAPSTGFAYVGETFASCIRSIELSTGAVRTVAGKCDTGGHRDTAFGEACAAARFNHPHKVTVDPRNESIVYVSDVECSDDGLFYLKDTCKPTYGGVAFTGVRKLEMHRNGSCARVSTVAGFFNASAPTTNPIGFADGSTATARFHYVHGVSIKPLAAGEKRGSGSSILYAIDDLNERVRKIDLAAGNVSTLAGTGRQGCKDGPGDIASFNAVGIAVGRDGSVYVADYENHKIRQLTMMKTDDMVAAKTPPMGWNSWATFGCGVNETILRNAADQIHKLGLGKAGYQYVNTDDCWMNGARDPVTHALVVVCQTMQQ